MNLPRRVGRQFGGPRKCVIAGLAIASAMHLGSAAAAAQLPPPPGTDPATSVVLEDYSDIVTRNDFGFNDFSGNTGSINKDGRPYGEARLSVPDDRPPALRFEWNFGIHDDLDAFTGLFHSLFGLTDTLVTFDGTDPPDPLFFPEHSLDLDDIDGILEEPGGPRALNSLHMAIRYTGAERLTLRLELKDAADRVRAQRFPLSGSPDPQVVAWDFRGSFLPSSSPDFDIQRAKVFTVIVERRHVVDQVTNPVQGSFDVERIWFELDEPETMPVGNEPLMDLLERRSCQYFVDWTSRKPESFGLPQDRSTFADLLTMGGVGFALPAAVICAERGWITRDQALERVLPVLRLLADRTRFGPDRVGRTGYRGWLYHFVGPDGKRKLNFDFLETDRKENLNTVELSTIDTGLALMGTLAAQSYFTGTDPEEVEVHTLAQRFYDNVDWPFMLERSTNQFYLGWKPNEEREPEPRFEIPDAFGTGHYSGVLGDPATLDFYTDEALIVVLLAVGSETHDISPDVYCALIRSPNESGLIRTFPGSLFTYQFLQAFLDTRDLGLRRCPGEQQSINWFDNSRKAILSVIEYAEENPRGLPTYGPDAWGISAAEGPDDRYRAYGAPRVAVNLSPEEDGTVTYYGTGSAIGFGDDLRDRALRALGKAWERGHWHARFGLPDAFHDAIEGAGLMPEKPLLRSEGTWQQRARFAIDEGPMLLHLENARSGLIWELLDTNPNIQRALALLRAPTITDTDPDSPANENSPRVKGLAATSSTVTLYTNGTCSGQVAATGSAAQFESPGLPVSVANDSTTTFGATTTTEAGDVSACSSSANAYVEDSTPPETTIDEGPASPTSDNTPTFFFRAVNDPGATFECRLDGQPFATCSSPHTTEPLPDGEHEFAVRAIDRAGNVDATPAIWDFRVRTGEDPPPCRGRRPTIVVTARSRQLTGTPGRDVILGTPGRDVIDARGGDDLICGRAGDDRLSGGRGSDSLAGQEGGDRLRGGRGEDRLSGDAGKDRLLGGTGTDRLFGGPGGDALDGGPHTDRCRGGPGRDTTRRCER